MTVIGSAICRSRVSSLAGQGLQHMQILVSQNRYKRSIVRRGMVVVLTAELKETGKQLEVYKIHICLNLNIKK